MDTIICKNCRKEFRNYLSNKRKFCSRKCYWESLKGNKLHLGYKHSKKMKERMRILKTGNQNCLGKHWKVRDEVRKNMGRGMLDKNHSMATREKMSQLRLGELNPRWIKNRYKAKRNLRNDPEYKQWVKRVKKRDKNICQLKNKDCSGYNIVHHIKNWSTHPELRYEINNGITLCQAHHPKKRAEEKRLEPILIALVSVSNV